MQTFAQLRESGDPDYINGAYNDWISKHCDTDERSASLANLVSIDAVGKAIPYMGWYWRSADFAGGWVTIATDGQYVAVCENNKWGYGQRRMTAEELTTFTGHIDAAIEAENANDEPAMWQHLHDLNTWMQTLDVPSEEECW
jgi:hypothetical protein